MKKLLLLIIVVLLLGGGIAFAETGEWRCANYVEVNKKTPCGGATGVDDSSNCPATKPECNSPNALICCKAGSVSTAPPSATKTSVTCDTYKYPWCEAAGKGLGGSTGLVNTFYNISLALVGVAAFGVIVYGGILYTISAGNSSKQQDAVEWITSAVWGVVLLFGAYFILNTINPELVELREPKIEKLNIKIAAEGGLIRSMNTYCKNISIANCNSDLACQTGKGTEWIGGETGGEIEVDICEPRVPDGPTYDGLTPGDIQSSASPALQSLINCIGGKLPGKVDNISGISDSKGYDYCKKDNNWKTGSSGCHHITSNVPACHYGGKTCADGSYAVDYDLEKYATQIKDAALACGAHFVYNENNHIHASVGSICGCDGRGLKGF